jgi:hypothetical protein
MQCKISSIKQLASVCISHGWVHSIRSIVFTIYCFAITTIILHGSVKLGFFDSLEIVAEVGRDALNCGDCFFDSGVISLVAGMEDGVKAFKFGEQLSPESIGRLVKSGLFVGPVAYVSDKGRTQDGSDNLSEIRDKQVDHKSSFFDYFW